MAQAGADIYERFFHNLPAMMAAVDYDGRFVDANSAWEAVLGRPAGSLAGTPCLDLVHPEDRERVALLKKKIIEGEPQALFEARFLCRDGAHKWFHMRCAADREKRLIYTAATDITSSKATEQALRESEETRRKIIDAAPMAMSIVNMDGVIEYINRKAVEVFGYPHSEIPNMDRWWVLAYPDEAYRKEVIERWMGRVHAAWEQKSEIAGGEYLVTCKDGTRKTCDIFGVIAADKVFVMFNDVTHRVEAFKALRENETTLLRILEQVPVSLAVHDTEGKVELVNRRFTEDFGYRLEDIPTFARWAEQAYPDPEYRRELASTWDKWVEKSLRTGQQMEGREVRLRCRSGEVRTVFITGMVTPDRKVIALLDDVTARSETERALRERESLYRALVETTQTGYVILDGQGKVLDANREYVRLSGHSDLKEIMGRSVLEWSAPHSQKRAWEAVEIVVRDGRLSNFELDYADKAGKFTTIEINATVVSRGGAKQILGLCRDVSARSKTEAQLRESESLYRALVETTRTGYVVIDNTGTVVDANREYVRLTGHADLKEILGRKVTEWTAPDLAEKNAAAVAQCARDGHIFNFETDYIDKAGKRTPIEINATVVSRGSGPQIHTICRDITERRRTEAELRLLNQGLEARVRERTAELSAANEDLMQEISQRVQAEKEKAKLGEELQQAQKMEAVGRLAGGIAHDFNNILVSISGYAEFLLKSLPEGAQGREDITEILFETEKGAALTRQLLTFSRKQPIKTEVLDLNEVVSETEKMLTRLVGANIRFEKRLAPVLDRITADPGQVSQVIMNLVLNARDAMPEGGRITLETRNAEIGAQYLEMRLAPKPGHYVLLSVSDTGSGMGPDAMHHIFEPFFTTKEEGKGTGLGLPTVYGIVSQARGGISVTSEPGKGSTFGIYFPRTLV
ncbi:MAG: PAS domain-containing sensor histidine kinase [Elusimicrobiales bacterium]